jgi:murein DD-endopeptidase MepM/ murein hydrolase activator NlpD
MRYRVTHIACLCALVLCAPFAALAATAAELQQQINDHNDQIAQLTAEIAQYQTQLDATSAKKQTLQTQLNQLNISIKKTTASIALTQNQISTTQLQIEQLKNGISQAESSIANQEAGLAESLQALAAEEAQPLAVQLLANGNLADTWDDISLRQNLNAAIDVEIAGLQTSKRNLTDAKTANEQKQAQLLAQQKTLLTQQGSLNATKKAQSELLAQTKSQESTYQALIAQKKAQQTSFESELANLKSEYNQLVSPSEITPASPGILAWPIAGKIIITQYFGNTPFADAHAALYSGHGHNAIDIGVPIGTPIRAALSGVILGTGNTDAVRSCLGGSFGKWVMIKHNNGLNTMYAHLSEIDVAPGQTVTTGDVIGYSGETGYATGPHLHFGVYVSAVTKIIQLGQATGGSGACSKAVMPVAPLSGYLNPLNYLPAM